MAVDKFSGSSPNLVVNLLTGGVTLEDTLARFDEQVSHLDPIEFRKRLKKGLSHVQVNINGLNED